jgi:hypothetical protein
MEAREEERTRRTISKELAVPFSLGPWVSIRMLAVGARKRSVSEQMDASSYTSIRTSFTVDWSG